MGAARLRILGGGQGGGGAKFSLGDIDRSLRLQPVPNNYISHIEN